MEGSEAASWANPRPPLLELILEHLPCADYLRFAGVCCSWRDAQQDHRLRHAASPRYKPEMPWMMFLNRQSQSKVFYNPSEKRYYSLSFPKNYFYQKLSTHGWFYSDSGITNPFTCSQIPIPSPPESNLDRSVNFGDLLSGMTDTDSVLLSNFTDKHGSHLLYFYRFSDRTWARLKPWIDISAVCGGKFYGLLLDKKSLAQVEPFPVPVVRNLDMYMAEDLVLSQDLDHFLVECDGHILLVQIIRTFRDMDIYYKIQILRADLSRKVWVRLESLGNNVLFMSNWTHTSSFSMSGADTGGPRNHIYFWEKNEKMLIEYDYQSHHVVHRSIPHLMEHDWIIGGIFLSWMVPSL